MNGKREFFCRIPASLVKDSALSPAAKVLYLVLAAHADARTGRTFVRLRTIERLLRWGRWKRENAQKELAASGWLRLTRKPCARGRWGTRVFVLSLSAPFLSRAANARFHRSGEIGQLDHYHSQVRRSV